MNEPTETEPLFLQPIFHDKMWGGSQLKDFNLKIKNDKTGEAWLASTYGHDLSKIMNGKHEGQTLKQVWEAEPQLFDNHRPGQAFPLLIKMLDAKENLSIQVHPDDESAQKFFSEPNGKTECWYILEAKPGAVAYYGHQAQSAEAMKAAIENHELAKLLETITVKAGDMIYVPGGTLHALGAGIVALEVEQSSDNTLRFYDFDRVDPKTGKKRPLQIEQAIAVTNFPNQVPDGELTKPIMDADNSSVTSILRTKYFKVNRIKVTNDATITSQHYSVNTVISGSGKLTVDNHTYLLETGMTFIIPSTVSEYQILGKLTLIQAVE